MVHFTTSIAHSKKFSNKPGPVTTKRAVKMILATRPERPRKKRLFESSENRYRKACRDSVKIVSSVSNISDGNNHRGKHP